MNPRRPNMRRFKPTTSTTTYKHRYLKHIPIGSLQTGGGGGVEIFEANPLPLGLKNPRVRPKSLDPCGRATAARVALSAAEGDVVTQMPPLLVPNLGKAV